MILESPWIARVLLACMLGGSVSSCDADGNDEPPAFPDDYASSYVEVRDCRASGDHDLNNIRVLADPQAAGPYQDRDAPFPEGAVLLKEEYEFGDIDCGGDIVQWTVMLKLAAGTSPDTLDWAWQRVDASRRITGEDLPRCIQCHKACGSEPDGYDGTCTMP